MSIATDPFMAQLLGANEVALFGSAQPSPTTLPTTTATPASVPTTACTCAWYDLACLAKCVPANFGNPGTAAPAQVQGSPQTPGITDPATALKNAIGGTIAQSQAAASATVNQAGIVLLAVLLVVLGVWALTR
jgi:hypothetical protein